MRCSTPVLELHIHRAHLRHPASEPVRAVPDDFTFDATGVESVHPNGFTYSVWPSWLSVRQAGVPAARYGDVFRRHRQEAEAEALALHQRGSDPVVLTDLDSA